LGGLYLTLKDPSFYYTSHHAYEIAIAMVIAA